MEVRKRIHSAYGAFYSLKHLLTSKSLSRGTKIMLYKTLIRVIALYGSESWNSTQADEDALGVFERRILRAIFGPVKEGEEYRSRHNNELYLLFQDADIVTVLRVNRLRWAGHVYRRPQDAPILKVTTADFIDGKRSRGRPKNTWIGCVDKDARVLNIPNWQKVSKDRAVFRHSLRAAMGPRAPQPRKKTISVFSLFLLNSISLSSTSDCYCDYDFHDYRGYGCEATGVTYLNEYEDFNIDGDHFPLDNDNSVQVMTFKKSVISYIPRQILETFKNLRYLEITNAKLKTVNERSLDGCKYLKDLNLEGNEITELRSGIFQQCTNLLYLRLPKNKIDFIDPNAFIGLGNLWSLDLQDNLMSEVNPAILTPLWSMVTFFIGSKNLNQLDKNLFLNSKNLLSLYIYRSPISELHPDTFLPLAKLSRLTIFKVQLTKLNPGTFRKLKNLPDLMISVGYLTEISAGTFTGLSKVMQIDLSWHRITKIDPHSFDSLSNIEYFYIPNNRLTELDNQLLASNPKVKYLDISFNFINGIQEGFFDSFGNNLKSVLFMSNVCIDKNFGNSESSSFTNFTTQVLPYFRRCFRNYNSRHPVNP